MIVGCGGTIPEILVFVCRSLARPFNACRLDQPMSQPRPSLPGHWCLSASPARPPYDAKGGRTKPLTRHWCLWLAICSHSTVIVYVKPFRADNWGLSQTLHREHAGAVHDADFAASCFAQIEGFGS